MTNTKTMKCPTCKGTGEVVDPDEVGKELRTLRRAADMTQDKLASKLKCSKSHISAVERGFPATTRLERDWRKAVRR